MAKISTTKRQDIITAHQTGVSAREIAKRFGISNVSVSDVIRAWKATGVVPVDSYRPHNAGGYDDFYRQAAIIAKRQPTWGHIRIFDAAMSETTGKRPPYATFKAWWARNGRARMHKIEAEILHSPIAAGDWQDLGLMLFRYFRKRNAGWFEAHPIWCTEFKSECQAIACEASGLWATDKNEAFRIIGRRVSEFLRHCGRTRSRAADSEIIYSDFDYESEEGRAVKQILAAYWLFGFAGVCRIAEPVRPKAARNILAEHFRKS